MTDLGQRYGECLREGANRHWNFAISDAARKVAIDTNFSDDCELAVEKP